MIFYLTTKRHAYTINKCLRTECQVLRKIVQPMCYGTLFLKRSLPFGTYVFSDYERIPETDLTHLTAICRMVQGNQNIRILNHPDRTLQRLALLQELYRRRINRFTAYRLQDRPRPARFPVFVRGEDDHKGPLSPLIHSQNELDQVYHQWARRWGGTRRKLVIEHCRACDENGIFRKYAAFRIGDRVIPRHLFFSEHWCVKSWDLLDDHLLDEERRYVAERPHDRELIDIFDLAGVDFGRIDYGIVDGRIQVWEINTNPMLPVDYGGGGESRQALHDEFTRHFVDAMRAIDSPLQATAQDNEPAVSMQRRAVPLWAAPAIPARVLYRRISRGARRRAG